MEFRQILFLIIFMSILALPDIYIFFSRIGRAFKSKWAKRTWNIVFWTFFVAQWSCLVSLFVIGETRGISSFTVNMLRIGFVAIFVSKLVMVTVLLLGHIFRLGEKIFTNRKHDEPGVSKRRDFIKKAGIVTASIPFLSFIHGLTMGKYSYKVRKQTLHFKDLPEAFDGFTIAQFSDFHAGTFDSMSGVTKGVELLNQQNADLILFTGDLVNALAEEAKPYTELLNTLTSEYGQYAVLGNHDYGWGRNRGEEVEKDIRDVFDECGLTLLNNENIKLEKGGESIRIVGVENWGHSKWFPKRGDLDKAYVDVKDGEFNVLMSHDPSHWREKVLDFKKHVHLTLSGHTHGMQFGFRFGNFKWSPSKYSYPEWGGLYTEKDGQNLYVNCGFGMLNGFPIRIGIDPEITVFELKKA
ncbi:MAG: metallophosphoesterase [Saprospiraceae bacterium]